MMKERISIIVGVAGVILIFLDLASVISWPWYWVFAPFWMVGAFLLLAFGTEISLNILEKALKG